MKSGLRRGALGFGLVALIGTASMPALAQHVVTEQEAAKLTLEALTAPPRPVYRPLIRVASYRYLSMRGRWHGREHLFTRAAYHPVFRPSHEHAHHFHRR